MAASAKMSFNYYQNGKYGTLPADPQKDMEVSQDMHLKMSKKIAQLTKVIYALNTKNDEHDAVIHNLKEQHEEEIQKILSETKEKISVFKRKLDEENDYRQKIASMETTIANHERYKQEAVQRFETFKQHAEERECQVKMEHSQKLLGISQEVLTAKKRFDKQLELFEEWKQNVDSEKEQALSDMKKAHQVEMDELRSFQRSQNTDWLNECAKVEDKFKGQIEELKTQLDSLNVEKAKSAEEYEAKLVKAQAFYEKELAALKQSQLSLHENSSKILLEEQEKMKKEFAVQERELKKQIESLVNQLSVSEDEVEKHKSELEKLKLALDNHQSSSGGLQKLLEEAKNEASNALTRLKEIESELTTYKERCKEQAEDLRSKSSLIGELEATKLQQQSLIQEQNIEIQKLKDKLAWLESQWKSVESEKDSMSKEQNSQLVSLQKSLDDLSLEKQTLMARYERDLQSLRDKMAIREKELADKHAAEKQNLNKTHQDVLKSQQEKANNLLYETKQKMVKQHEADLTKVSEEKDALIAEYDHKNTDLSNKLAVSEEEVRRLEKILKDSESGLGTASSKINSLKEATARLQSDLEKSREEIKTHKTNAANYKAELEKLKKLHESKLAEAQQELKNKLDQLAKDLESKWSDNLRKECARLKLDLTQQKDEEKKAALQQLARLKDEEVVAARRGWENKVHELNNQLDKLKRSLEDKEGANAEEIERLRKEMEEEKKRLEKKLVEAGNEYAQQISSMEEMQLEKMRRLAEQKDDEAKELENKLKSEHSDDMQRSMTAHKATIESLKSEAEKSRLLSLQEAKQEHHKETEKMKELIYERHSDEMEELKRGHSYQLDAARMELDRAVEISKQKDKAHAIQVDELKDEVTGRELHIKNLKDDVKGLKSDISKLTREIEVKGNEILKIRSDANLQLKKREEVLVQKFQHEIECVKADHQREAETLMADFSEAQELLKDKISELQIMLKEAEEKYNNRESRPEDLEAISQLRDAIREREMRMKTLIEEKQYYQMELVNRETNFNKVFNTDPKVGVLNPLQKKSKKGEKGGHHNLPSKHTSSAPSLNRLDPIPNSPIHNANLNPSKPLGPTPAFTKKFVR
ncbi:protein FAM184A-like [Ylistrum balloti]|uniref:protein FAM184A-like n=1 Tax=Ylistrum balloti TaxID=509963 RepID=UPI002905E655|nr:protein FAM184A-like [Ylistrum balloti]